MADAANARLYLNDVVRLGDDNRVTFPARLLRLVDWFDGMRSVRTTAELLEVTCATAVSAIQANSI